MANRPTVGGSDGTWGTELNNHLAVSLDANGKIKDHAEQTTEAAPTANKELANKKYVDNEITTLTTYVDDEVTTLTSYVDNQVATKAMGGYATDDDDSQTMVAAHAYLAQQDGTVYVVYTTGPAGGEVSVYCYVDTDTNPASGGTIFAQRHDTIYTQVNDKFSLQFDVASGEYFEITKSNVASISIIWRSKAGTLVKCKDQD